ncbi:hypothetical protein [Roseibium sp.]|uniref:hypothetical protein n=1 Tax=Roseibium sp. TaxID=1936156 RepID=UPI003A97196C
MPRPLGAGELAFLEEHVDVGDRIAYYDKLVEWGYRYGELAGAVVVNDSVAGVTANYYFLQGYLEDTGALFDVDDLARLSLGPVDKVSWPETCSGEIEESCEGRFGFIVSCSDPAELFDLVEHSLDPVPVLVGPEVTRYRFLAV